MTAGTLPARIPAAGRTPGAPHPPDPAPARRCRDWRGTRRRRRDRPGECAERAVLAVAPVVHRPQVHATESRRGAGRGLGVVQRARVGGGESAGGGGLRPQGGLRFQGRPVDRTQRSIQLCLPQVGERPAVAGKQLLQHGSLRRRPGSLLRQIVGSEHRQNRQFDLSAAAGRRCSRHVELHHAGGQAPLDVVGLMKSL